MCSMLKLNFKSLSAAYQEEPAVGVDTVPKKWTSKLDVKLQSLLELICDLKAMEECVLEMKFDTRKAPLGQSRDVAFGPLTTTDLKLNVLHLAPSLPLI